VAQFYPQALGSLFFASYDSQGSASTRESTTTVLPNTSYNHFARTTRKTPSSIVKNACLLVRYLAVDVLLLLRERVLWECV
jgi:hypothetical protein